MRSALILLSLTSSTLFAQSCAFNGIKNQICESISASQVVGVAPLYNPDGTPIVNGRCVQAVVTGTSSGTWSLDYTQLKFSKITSWRADASNPTSSSVITSQYLATINPPSLTSIGGLVLATVSVTVATVTIPILSMSTNAAVPISVSVCGS